MPISTKFLEISYSVWKQVVQDNSWIHYKVNSLEGNYLCVTGNNRFVYTTLIHGDDKSDYDATFMKSSVAVNKKEDAYAFIIGVKKVPRELVSMDGHLLVTPQVNPADTGFMFAGRADDIENGIRFGGNPFQLSRTSVGASTLEWQFSNSAYISGGRLNWENAVLGDYFDYGISAEASVGSSNPGSGNYSKVELAPGLGMYIPTPGGDWDLDLDEPWNENVQFSKLSPVPANGSGYFDYDFRTETLTINVLGQGDYNLFDFPVNLAKLADRNMILGSHVERIEKSSEIAKLILPQWKHTATLYNSTMKAAPLSIVWSLFVARLDLSF